MRCISSQFTFFYKYLLPATSLIFASLLAIFTFTQGVEKGASAALLPLAALVMLVALTFVLFKTMMFGLADEVYDEGDALHVRNDDRADRIAFSDIATIVCPPTMKPPRVTVTLRNPGIFGNQIAFLAAREFISRPAHAGIDALIQRVNESTSQVNAPKLIP